MIIEVIVTTQDAQGRCHIAPMGVHVEGEGRLAILPFRPSRTLDNLMETGVAVVNYTDDARIFAGCLTGRRDWPLVPAAQVQGQALEAALSWDEVTVESYEDDPVRPRFSCRVVAGRTRKPFRGLNRAKAAVVEGAILVSRLSMLPAERIDREMAVLASAVDKTAGPDEREAWGWLVEAVEEYRRRQAAQGGAA